MNTFIWILQGLAGAIFLMAGFMKLSTPKAKLEEKMGWAKDFTGGTIQFIGAMEVLGAVGLVLPMALGILPVLTPLAAFALGLVMLLAMRTHVRRKEQNMLVVNAILMALVVVIGLLRI